MALIEADLTSVNKDGYLKASRKFLSLREGEPSTLLVGERVTVRDLFGAEEFDAEVVGIIGEDSVLLDVNWDDEKPPAIVDAKFGSNPGLVLGQIVFLKSRVSSPFTTVPVHDDIADDAQIAV